MSDTHDPIPVAPPVPPPQPPLDLHQFAAPPADPALRQTLLVIGVQLGMLMLNNRTTPEEVAQKMGVPVEIVYAVMTGCKEDIGLRSLSDLAKMLKGNLLIQLASPGPQTPPTTPPA